MVHTLPDYTSKWKTNQITDVIDPGEAAARLGSIDTFQREGNVLWLDDFESATLGWHEATEDVSGEVVLVTTYHRSGSQCVKIYPGTVVDQEAVIQNLLPIRSAGKMGYEIAFSGGTLCKYVDFRMRMLDGTNVHQAEILFDIVNNRLEYLNDAGGQTVIAAGLDLLIHPLAFHIIKFVVDWNTDEYDRVYLNQTEYDISGNGVYVAASPANRHFYVGVRVESNNALNAPVYVDNFILTENER